jgi:Mg-chelatase subunit ChlD
MADYISGTEKINAAKNAVVEFIRSKFLMGQGDRVGMISFGQYATIIEKPSVQYEFLENRVDALRPNGATAMFEGLRLSLDNLSTSSGAKRIVLLTDGIPTTTGRMSIISLAKEAATRKIVIDTVGVGTPFDLMGYDEMLLRRIAAITGGTFRRVMDIEQLSGQFRELAEGKNYTHLLPEK